MVQDSAVAQAALGPRQDASANDLSNHKPNLNDPSLPTALLTMGPNPGPTVSHWARPTPQGNSLNSVWIAPWGDIMAVGEGGTILQSTDKGKHWDVRQIGDVTINTVWGQGDDRVFLLGERGTLYLSNNRGRSYVAVATNTRSDLYSICGRGSDIYIAASDGVLLRSSDAGANWELLRLPPVTPGVSDTPNYYSDANDLVSITVGSRDRVVTIAYGGAVYYSDDHGQSWKQRKLTTSELGLPAGSEKNDKLALMRVLPHGGEFLILTRYGFPTQRELPSDQWSPALRFSGDIIEPWPIHMALDEEVTESLDHAPNSNWAMHVDAAGTAVMVGEGDILLASLSDGLIHSADYASDKHAQSGPLQDISGTDQFLFAVGAWGRMMRSVDGGRRWNQFSHGTVKISALWADGDRSILFGQDGLQTSSDGGKTWTEPQKPSKNYAGYAAAAWGASSHVYAAAGSQLGVMESKDGGSTWVPIQLQNKEEFFPTGGWTPDGTEVTIAGDLRGPDHKCLRGTILTFRNEKWSKVMVPKGASPMGGEPCTFSAVHGNSDRTIYAVGSSGLIYRSIRNSAFAPLSGFGRNDNLIGVHAGLDSRVWVLVKTAEGRKSRFHLKFSRDAGLHFSELPPPLEAGEISAIGGSKAGELVVAQNGHIYERTDEAIHWTELTNGAFVASTRITSLTVPAPRHVIVVGDQGAVLEIRPVTERP